MIDLANFFDLSATDRTAHAAIFKDVAYVWEVIPRIEPYLLTAIGNIDADHQLVVAKQLSPVGTRRCFVGDHTVISGSATLSEGVAIGSNCEIGPHTFIGSKVIIGDGSRVAFGAYIGENVLIGAGCDIRTGALIRNNAIIGDGVTIGNSTELKNCLLFNEVELPHFNYVGDSILGWKAHLGAGAKVSNVRIDKQYISLRDGESVYETGLRKFGAIIGDEVEIGCNAVLNPGSMVGANTLVYPNTSLRGIYGSHLVIKLKQNLEVVERK